MRVVGENMFAKHSIHYTKLSTYFYIFAIFQTDSDGTDWCCDWDYTSSWATRWDLPMCPITYIGPWEEQRIKADWNGESFFGDVSEGYVVRNANDFLYNDFGLNIAKYVRENHVQTDENWFFQKVIPNHLKGKIQII